MKDHKLKLIDLQKVKDGRFIKNYQLTYQNRNGNHKKYEMISYNDIDHPHELGQSENGVAIIAFNKGKLLLLREFRMAVNDYIFNLVAGTMDTDETVEACVKREIFEETGLTVDRFVTILPPTFAAASMTDLKITFVVVEVSGDLDHKNVNEHEVIEGGFYTPEEVRELLYSSKFNANCQLIAYFYSLLIDFSALVGKTIKEKI
jgi:ADP-ribose pyrophosphatase